MGHADLKYGDSVVFIQHEDSGLWLSYITFETKKRGIGRVEEKKVGHLLSFSKLLYTCSVMKLVCILSYDLIAHSKLCLTSVPCGR